MWALCLLAVLGFSRLWLESSDPLQRFRGQNSIRIGYAVEAPFAFLRADRQPTGESPEVALEVCRRLGLERIEWCLTEFGSLIDGLQREQFDVIAAGMFITEARREKVCFSRPTFSVGSALLTRRLAPLPGGDYSELSRSKARVAVLTQSYEEARFQALGLAEDRLLRVPDARTGCALVMEGKADALALSGPTLRWMSREQPGLSCLECGEEQRRFQGAFAFRKQDDELCQAWNRVLETYIGSREHRALLTTFGFRPDEVP